MNGPARDSNTWTAQLAEFLRRQPAVTAVRLDPASHRVSVATLGPVEIGGLADMLAATIASVEEGWERSTATPVPKGFLVRRDGSSVIVGRETCTTAERLWLWRDLEWPDLESQTPASEWRTLAGLAAACGLFGLGGYSFEHMTTISPIAAHALYLAGLVAGGWEAAIDTWENLREKRADIHLLMLVVAIGAVCIGAWSESVLLLFLFSASGAMEEYSVERTQRDVGSLLKSAPKTATLVNPDGTESLVAVASLEIGQRIRVRPGEAYAADGTVLTGRSASDESALTGESLPVPKERGDSVFSGTLNEWGIIEFEVVRLPSESTLHKIIRLIQTAQKLRAPSERFTDKFGTKYTYAVLVGAAVAFAIWWLGFHLPAFTNAPGQRSAFYRAMTLMVVASPCALVLSIPSAIMAAIAWGARHGILFRGGAAIEKLAEVGVVALDKTGTLTTGDLAVVGCESFPPGRESEVLALAYSLEIHSQHPIARAIVRHAKATGAKALEVDAFRSVTGQGLRGEVGGSTLLLGRRELLEAGPLGEWAKSLPAASAEFSEVWVIGGDLVGRLLLRDQIRTESSQVLRGLKDYGVRSVMLTGDRSHAAEAVAKELGVDDVRAGLTPEGKVESIRNLGSGGIRVAMVGDGVNDAPSLAAAYVGIAMGARGSDAALEQAEVVLMHDRIENVLAAYRLGRRARRVIRQNLTIALGVVVVMVIATAIGKVPLSTGVAAHEGSTVVVCLNSLRLLFSRAEA